MTVETVGDVKFQAALASIMNRVVPPALLIEPGPGEARIAVVGEAPGETEAREQVPFVGRSGKLLRQILKANKYDDRKLFFTDVVNVRPIDNATPETDDILGARQRLLEELHEFNPDKILCVGGVALNGLLGGMKCDLGITEWRGIWQQIRLGEKMVWVLPTLHPAALLRAPRGFPDFCRDISRLGNCPESECPAVSSVFYPTKYICNTYEEALDCYEKYLKFQGIYDRHWRELDIETNGETFDPRWDKVISIAFSPSVTISCIFTDQALADGRTVNLLRLLAEDARLWHFGQNAIAFDHGFIKYHYGVDFKLREDTMLLKYGVDERPNTHGLKALGQNYCGWPDWSKELKKWLGENEGSTYGDVPREQLYVYQSVDTAVGYQVLAPLLAELKEEGPEVEWAYRNILIPAAWMLRDVRSHGIHLDLNYLDELEVLWTAEKNALLVRLQEIVGPVMVGQKKTPEPFNPNSPKQVGAYLYDRLKIPRPDTWGASKYGQKKKATSTDEDVLNDISAQGLDPSGFVDLMLEHRKLNKFLGTYVTGLKNELLPDGKLHSNLTLTVTETGRLASRNPNLQNVPKHDARSPFIRAAFIPEDGFVLLDADYSQLEYRVAAYLSRDPGLIAAFHSGIDFHTSIAAQIFNKDPKDVTKLERHSAKFVNFGIMYGRQAQSLWEGELKHLCKTVQEAQVFVDTFLARFPRMRDWFLETEKLVTQQGYVQSAFGRRRRFPFIPDHHFKAEAQRQARNMPVQSTASDICLMAAVAFHNDPRVLKDECRVLFLVHDNIVCEAREDKQDYYAGLLREIMENPWDYLPIEKGVVPFPVDLDITDRWARISEDSEFAHTLPNSWFGKYTQAAKEKH